MKDHIIFDTQDAVTIADSDSVGAFLRSDLGTLLTHSAVTKPANDMIAFAFVDGDVTVGTDSINEVAHGLETGDKVQLTSTGVLPAGLALATDYFVIRVDADNIKLAASAQDAADGVEVTITAAAGGGTHTATQFQDEDKALDVHVAKSVLQQAEDSAHISGDLGSMALAVRNDSEGSLVDADGDYAPLQVDASGRLRVIADIDITNQGEKAEDSVHASGDIGNYVLAVRQDVLASSVDADGDYGSFKLNSKGELYVTDVDGNALLTTIDGDTGNIALDTAAMVIDLAAIEVEQLAQGVTLDALLVDTNAMVVDLAAIEVELLAQGITLDALLVDTNAIVVDLAAIEVELLAQGVTLDSILVDTSVIAGDTTSIDASITALSKTEDAVHASGDKGIMGLAVRNDTLGSLVDADGDYAPLQVNASGELYVTIGGEIDVDDTANTAIASAANPLSVANVAEDVVASPLANRKYLFIYNNGNKKAYIGQSGVSASTGFPVSPGSYMELRAGAAIDIEWVSADTAQEVRTMELS